MCQKDPGAVPSLPTPRLVWTAGGGSCPSESRTNGGSRAADQHVLKVGKKKRTVQSEEDADEEKKQFAGNYFVSGALYVKVGTGEKVAAVLPQFEGL